MQFLEILSVIFGIFFWFYCFQAWAIKIYDRIFKVSPFRPLLGLFGVKKVTKIQFFNFSSPKSGFPQVRVYEKIVDLDANDTKMWSFVKNDHS